MKDLAYVMKLTFIEKKDILLSILYGFIAGMSAVILFGSSGYLISKAALGSPLSALILLIAMVKVLGFVRAFSRYMERLYSHSATFTMLSNLRVSFYEKLEPLAPNIFSRYRSGDLLARIVGDVETLQNYFLRVFYPPIVLIIVFLSTILLTSFFSIYIAGVLLLGLLLTTFIIPALFSLNQGKIDRKVRESRGVLSTEVTELLYGFRDLKIYQQLNEKEAQLTEKSNQYIQEQVQEGVQRVYSESVNTFASLFISGLVIAIGAYLIGVGELEGVYLAMVLMISLTVFENAAPMAVFPSHLQDNKQAAKRLFSVVGHSKIEADRVYKYPAGSPSHTAPLIEMKDVYFTFEDASRPVLEGVSLILPKGSKTAIVGPSGSGKSTVLQLLLKIQHIDQGDIYINDETINAYAEEAIWEQTNVVLQKNHFFYGTIKDNLMIAKDGLSDLEMEAILKQVKLGHFSLTNVVLEKGENLSGGEKQRLALARAMLKGARLWLLDEPTSSVDAVTEAYLYENLFERAKDDTVVLVSHRLTGLEAMDQIIVMNKGKVVEAGTYDALMKQKGYFYDMKQIEQSVFM